MGKVFIVGADGTISISEEMKSAPQHSLVPQIMDKIDDATVAFDEIARLVLTEITRHVQAIEDGDEQSLVMNIQRWNLTKSTLGYLWQKAAHAAVYSDFVNFDGTEFQFTIDLVAEFFRDAIRSYFAPKGDSTVLALIRHCSYLWPKQESEIRRKLAAFRRERLRNMRSAG